MKDKIIFLLRRVILEDVEIQVMTPDLEEQGHYSTNVAFRLAKLRKTSPQIVAEDITGKLKRGDGKIFQKVTVAGGGFINFWVRPKALQEELAQIVKSKKLNVKSKGLKIQIEYVSANPTGPLTLANGRGGFLGDVLANVLEMVGYKVEREYYINDVGNQILTLGKSILAVNDIIPEAEEFYKGDYVKDWAKKNKKYALRWKNNPMKLGQMAAKDFLQSIKQVLEKKAKIKFDKWTSEEKDIHKKKLVEKALAVFKKKGFVYEKDGAIWLKTIEFGDDKDRVLVTSTGLPTYFLADGGHYLETWKRGFKRKINVLGPDHYGYVKRIQAVAKILGFEKSEVIITQALRLVRDGKEAKMSKRKGQFVTFEELVDEVGLDAARFFFLMVSYDSHMDFDMALAKEKSNKNPVYYAQYAYVRVKGILRKSEIRSASWRTKSETNSKFKIQNSKLSALNTLEDIRLMRELARFSEVIEDTAGDYQVHRLTRYATELARAFHNFYEKERIIPAFAPQGGAMAGKEEKNLAEARLVLVQATEIIFQKLFGILGISAPERM